MVWEKSGAGQSLEYACRCKGLRDLPNFEWRLCFATLDTFLFSSRPDASQRGGEKRKWTAVEDAYLAELVKEHGSGWGTCSWTVIANQVRDNAQWPQHDIWFGPCASC